MQLRNIMTETLVTIEPSAPLEKTAQMMREAQVGMVPVVESGRPVGVITDRDLALRTIGVQTPPKLASEVMTRNPICIHEAAELDFAVETMRARRVGRLLVTDELGRLVGVVSHDDVAVALGGDRRVGKLAEGLGMAHRKVGTLAR